MSDDPLLNKGELGPYKIERKLGQGAMGGVYLGMHRVLQVHHAIKVIHPKLIGDNTLVERFLREARNTAKLKHMNIVQVVGADQVEGVYYLAMEFVAGKTLEQLMRDPGLNIHDAVRYIHMVANALHYAHTRNIIHRDIKPANIMVNDEDVAKLMDFGLVRDIGQPEGGESGEQLTMAGYIMGTPQYMPLEQWQGEGVDHRSDIYALGATLYVMLTGKIPFPGKNARDIFRAVLTSQAKPVNEHNPDIDPELAQIVHTAIAPEKEDRYQSAQDFALALEAWWDQHPYQGTSLFKAPTMEDARTAGGRSTLAASARTKAPGTATRAVLQHGSTLEGSTPTAMDQLKRSNAPLIVAAVLLLVIIGGIAAFFAFGGKEAAPPALAFELALPPQQATQAQPLAVNTARFAIAGTSNGDVTLNGKAYTLGAAIDLKPGLNTLLVSASLADATLERTLYVLLDTQAPVISVPSLAGRDGNVIPVTARAFKLEGTVSDEGAGLAGLKTTLRIDNSERELPLAADGAFSFEIPVADSDVTIELSAIDRAGNASGVLTFWVSPDRTTLALLDAPTRPRWFTTREFMLTGKLSKSRGVTLTVDGKAVKVAADGSFTAGISREPGTHTIVIAASDWLGARLEETWPVVVDLTPPVLEVSAPTTGVLRVESLPAGVLVRGMADSADAVVRVNGQAVKVGIDGAFGTELKVEALGEFKVSIEATDPADRTTREEVVLDIRRLLYKAQARNAQGYTEYLRLSDGAVMVAIPGGKFTRGSGGALSDAPNQEVELTAFLIAKHETSNEQFAKFLTESKVNADDAVGRGWLVRNASGAFTGLRVVGNRWSAVEGDASRPVVNVTWEGALAYCQWADADSGSLPSEAQWEYAARGAGEGPYPWGSQLANARRTNISDSGYSRIIEVDKLPDGDSPFGLRMMAGNAEEWCYDWYTEGYSNPEQKGTDPLLRTRPGDEVPRRVVRGGGWRSPRYAEATLTADDEPGDIRVYARARLKPDSGTEAVGFRAAARMPKD